MTALEAFERVEQLSSYVSLLNELYKEHSNWNAEFGEGNPQAVLIKEMKEEFLKELRGLNSKLKNVSIK